MGFSIATVAAAVIAAGATVYTGEVQKKAMTKQLRQKKKASEEQAAAASSAQKLAAQEAAKANQKKPDVSTILGAEEAAGSTGPASTLLTGAGGVGKGSLLLGKSSLVGGA